MHRLSTSAKEAILIARCYHPAVNTRSLLGASLFGTLPLAPILVVLLLCAVEVARYAASTNAAANAVRAGLQYGAQNLTTARDVAGIERAALSAAQPGDERVSGVKGLCSSDEGATLTACASPRLPVPVRNAYYVEVQVRGVFKPLLSYLHLANPVALRESAVMRIADQ